MTVSKETYESFVRLARMSKDQPTFGKAYELILSRGQEFTNVNKELSLKIRKTYGLKNKQCFANCQRMAFYQGFTYYEGLALSTVWIPVSHAWLVTPEGEVVDPTWMRPRKPLTANDYFGIAVPVDFICKHQQRTGYYDELLPYYVRQLLEEQHGYTKSSKG